MRDLAPGPRGGLALAIAAAGLLGLARLQGAPLAADLMFDALVVLAAGGLGLLLGASNASLFYPPRRDLTIALAAALGCVVLVLAWSRVEAQFGAPEWAWLRSLAGGIGALPALLAAGLVRRPGAAALAMLVQALAVAFSGVQFAAAALLYVPLVALPVELWLRVRHQDGGALSLAVAGAILGAVNAVLARPELLAKAGAWPVAGAVAGATVGGALFGLAAHGVARWLRPRLGHEIPSHEGGLP